MIKMQIIGFLGQDATVNQVGNGTVINFSVAHTEFYMKGEVKHQKTTWVSCNYWTDKTTVAQYLRKGTQVYAEGQPEARAYEDRTRTMQAELKLRVFSIQLLGSKDRPEGGNNSQQGHPSTATADDITEPIDDLPF